MPQYNYSTKWADIFYNAGFCDFIEDLELANNPLKVGFFEQSFAWIRRFDMVITYSKLTTWFLSKGLSLEDTKLGQVKHDDSFVYMLPKSHSVGKNMGTLLWLWFHLFWDGSKPALYEIHGSKTESLLSKIVNNRIWDSCKCMCSLNGCYAITIMLKQVAQLEMEALDLHKYLEEYHKWWFSKLKFVTRKPPLNDGLSYLVFTIDAILGFPRNGWDFSTAQIIRFLTFTGLELTHTCCVLHEIVNVVRMFDDENRVEIQDEERVGLDELEKLMLEFEHAYTGSGFCLSEFLWKYWDPRMEELMSDTKAMDEEEARQIRELGVVLES